MMTHHHNTKTSYDSLILVCLIALFTLTRIYILSWHVWPVNGDEAQYFNWAKHLDWGYYSKPPMLAWLIALTTHFFGNGITAMRLASPLTHAVTAIFIYLSATRLWNVKVGFWSGLTYSLLPGVSFSATIISTDAPLLMFWIIAFYCFIRAIKIGNGSTGLQVYGFKDLKTVGDDQRNIACRPANPLTHKPIYLWWIFAGFALGCAMLSKYAAIFFPMSCLLFLISSAPHRYQLVRPGFYIMLIIAALLLIPNYLWNMHHHFASLKAVNANIGLQHNFFHPLNLLTFVGAQFAVFGPILFSVLLFMLLRINKLWRQEHYKICLCFIMPVFIVMITEAFISRANANWAAPMYLTATMAVCAYLLENKKMSLLIATLVLNVFVIIGLVNLQPLVQTLKLHIHQPTTVINWEQAGKQIQELRAQNQYMRIIVDDRMLLAEIMYFGKVPLHETYKWNPEGRLDDHYDLVTHLETQLHRNFLLFSYQPTPIAILQRFKNSVALPPLQLISLDGRRLTVYVYYVGDFQGYG